MNGPIVAGLNQSQNDVVTLVVPESAKWLGARVTAMTSTGPGYTREVTNSVGMQSDQSPHLSFATTDGAVITELLVDFADGSTQSIKPKINSLTKP